MSKMRMPEMDVVRFKESDVIVASGSLSSVLRIDHFNDGTKSNGTITVGSTVYGYSPASGSGITNEIVGSIYDTTSRGIEVRHGTTTPGWVSLSSLITAESTSGYTADGAIDGVYHYNTSTGNYDWYSNQ